MNLYWSVASVTCTHTLIWIYVSFCYSYIIIIIYFVLYFSHSEDVTLKTIYPTCMLKHYSCNKTYLLHIVEGVVHGEVSAAGWIWPKLTPNIPNVALQLVIMSWYALHSSPTMLTCRSCFLNFTD